MARPGFHPASPLQGRQSPQLVAATARAGGETEAALALGVFHRRVFAYENASE